MFICKALFTIHAISKQLCRKSCLIVLKPLVSNQKRMGWTKKDYDCKRFFFFLLMRSRMWIKTVNGVKFMMCLTWNIPLCLPAVTSLDSASGKHWASAHELREIDGERENEGCSVLSTGWNSLSISLCYLKLGSISCDDSFPTNHRKKWWRERKILYVCWHTAGIISFQISVHWGLKEVISW